MVTLDISGSTIFIRFPFSNELVERVKLITSDWRKRDGAWLASATRLEEIYSVFPDARASDNLLAWIELQRKLSAIKDPQHESVQPHWIACDLLPHQRRALEFLMRFERCAHLDPPGTGKTRVAAAWCAGKLPALIVCPSTVKFHWRSEILKCDPAATIVVINGNPKAFQGSDLTAMLASQYIILNYDILPMWLPLLPPIFKTLVADESHLCFNAASKRAQAIAASAKAIPNFMCVTGTPTLNRPVELESMLVD